MERKDFLKGSLGFLGITLLGPAILRSTGAASQTADAASCTLTNSETAGPFPTITPASLVQTNIVGDRTGVAFTVNVIVMNVNTCTALQNAIVDIWHCDKDGDYSEYGGTQLQPTDYTTYHFLRGRQTTDANGLVSFTSIFPGWYNGRATHIHVHVYDSTGNSLLVTQIAFPEGSGSAVETVNAATAYGYTQGMTGYTYNATDNVFSDGVSTELSTIAGSVSGGYTLDHTIYVSAAATGLADVDAAAQFQLGQNYPNPFDDETNVPLLLPKTSDVRIFVYDMQGRNLYAFEQNGLAAGSHTIPIQVGALGLSAGLYIYRVEVTNKSGTYQQSKVMAKK